MVEHFSTDTFRTKPRASAGTPPSARLAWALTVLLAAGCASLSPINPAGREPNITGSTRAEPLTGALFFEANRGQVDPSVRYLSRSASGTLFLTAREVVLVAPPSRRGSGPGGAAPGTDPAVHATRRGGGVVRLTLPGADSTVFIEGLDALPGRVHYLVGSESSRWQRDVPIYGRVRYRDVYPGIDLVFHRTDGDLEFDLVVAPEADPTRIRLRVTVEGGIALDRDGNLVLGSTGFTLKKPAVYQAIGGIRRSVEARYVRHGSQEFGFALGPRDPSLALVIDPVISFSTYLGGSGEDIPGRSHAFLDASGNVYVAGSTTSVNFPRRDPLQPTLVASRSCFVTKMDPATSSLVYSTYLGGSANTACTAFAVDRDGSVSVTGTSAALDYPVTASAVQQVNRGGEDIIVSRLAPAGNALLYSTYLGTPGSDGATGIAVNNAGRLWISGVTASTNFPVKNAFQAVLRGGSDAVLFSIDTMQSGQASLVFSTYFGGAGDEGAVGAVTIDATGDAVLVGSTSSTNLPVSTGAPQFMYAGGASDAFVARFDAGGQRLWATHLGGADADAAVDAVIDSLGNVYVTGTTLSFNFPVRNAVQPIKAPGLDSFLVKYDSAGQRVYATYFGGNGDDSARTVTVDAFGRPYIGGDTTSTNLPLKLPVKATVSIGATDGYLTGFDTAGASLVFSTYLGGAGADSVGAIAVDALGSITVLGFTTSLTGFPIKDAVQRTYGGGASDVFVSTIAWELQAHASVLPISRSVQAPTVASFFASMIVTGSGTASNCRIEPVTPTGAAFTYQTTDPITNAPTGTPNTPVSIPAGERRTFVIAFAGSGAFGPAEVILSFVCDNTAPAAFIPGVDAPTLAVSQTPVADIVALSATASNDGILTLVDTGAGPTGAFAVATVNVGASDLISVTADDGGAALPISLALCETNPATGQCVSVVGTSVQTHINGGATPTFAIFATAAGPVPFAPAVNRLFVRFRDAGGLLRGATSVAVRTP